MGSSGPSAKPTTNTILGSAILAMFIIIGIQGDARFGPFFTPGYDVSHLNRRHGGYGHHYPSYHHYGGHRGGHRAYKYGHSYGFLNGLAQGYGGSYNHHAHYGHGSHHQGGYFGYFG